MAASTTAEERAQLEANRRADRDRRSWEERDLDEKLARITGTEPRKRVVLEHAQGHIAEVAPHQVGPFVRKGWQIIGATYQGDRIEAVDPELARTIQAGIDDRIDWDAAEARRKARRQSALIARFEP